ncbi:hypothetical protein [Sphingomonas immobilis]|uniref:Mu-like prophage FluMu N-terminal domain-containing protein n=1 Tax=Sphingomonas immobilis TaxID=3063997 RepID=A0ABT8ZVC1_9SPHN|nr:hypothetical protein [Sphingomonas sp. CA1-15]MDO7841084.1 hypothetical protein [Sphingomonas sp. CA1-15]
MKEAVVTRDHIGEDQVQVSKGDELTLADERFDELRKRGLVKEKGDKTDVQPPQIETKLAPSPANKKAADAKNKAA